MTVEQILAALVLLVALAWGARTVRLRGIKAAEFGVMVLVAAASIAMGLVVNDGLPYSRVLLLDGRFYFVFVGYVFLFIALVSAVRTWVK